MQLKTYILRSALGSDFTAIDTVLSQTYPRTLKADYPPSVMVTAVPIISRANPQLVKSGTYYVAEDGDGWILGAGGWSLVGKRDTVAEVRHLVTDYRHQRRGVGRRLMMGILAEAGRLGIKQMQAQATRNAVPFYRAMGFEDCGEIVVPLRPGIEFPAVLMRRSV